jgi:hypothetical protein
MGMEDRLRLKGKNADTFPTTKEDIMSRDRMSRREFVGLTTSGIAGAFLGSAAGVHAGTEIEEWNPDKPYMVTGKGLRVQPVLMHTIHERRELTSWRSWGTISSSRAAAEEAGRISKELDGLSTQSDFPLEILPLLKVGNVEEARRVHDNDYDVVIVYPATGSGSMLRACFPSKPDRTF